MALAKLAENVGASVTANKFNALTATAMIGGEKVLLMEPLTFMNLSGNAVRAAADYYKIDPQDILILHDDMDLPVGSVRIRPKGSSGGQKGMKHIISCMGTDEIARIRIGVGAQPEGWDLADWVLASYRTREEAEAVRGAFQRAAESARDWVVSGIDHAMQLCNRK
jgi:PTH1 family peptidyl-tRNA hydrolase